MQILIIFMLGFSGVCFLIADAYTDVPAYDSYWESLHRKADVLENIGFAFMISAIVLCAII